MRSLAQRHPLRAHLCCNNQKDFAFASTPNFLSSVKHCAFFEIQSLALNIGTMRLTANIMLTYGVDNDAEHVSSKLVFAEDEGDIDANSTVDSDLGDMEVDKIRTWTSMKTWIVAWIICLCVTHLIYRVIHERFR